MLHFVNETAWVEKKHLSGVALSRKRVPHQERNDINEGKTWKMTHKNQLNWAIEWAFNESEIKKSIGPQCC